MDDNEFRQKVWMYANNTSNEYTLFRTIVAEHNRRMCEKQRRNYSDTLEACFIREVLHPKDNINLKDFYRKLLNERYLKLEEKG